MFENGAQLREGLQAFPDDPSGLTDAQAADGFAQLQRISELVEAKRLRWLADQDRRASHRPDGYLSTAAWLADRFQVAAGSAKRQVQVAQALEEMPQIRDSFLSGTVNSSAVQVLAEAHREHPDDFADSERELLNAAATKPLAELRRVVSDWVQAVGEQSPDRAEIIRGRRRFDLCPTPTRMVQVAGELDPEGGEVLMTALQAVVDAELRANGGRDSRTPTQRRADALCELAHRYLQSPERPGVAGERPHITLTVDVETLSAADKSGTRSRCELDHTGSVQPSIARRLACDASVMRIVMAGPAEPRELGRRTPVVSAGIRRAVALRDRQCRFPACTRPHAWCDAHHVIHWADGGETALRNLVLLCRPHHRLVHEGGFRLEMHQDQPLFRRPDGSILEDDRGPP